MRCGKPSLIFAGYAIQTEPARQMLCCDVQFRMIGPRLGRRGAGQKHGFSRSLRFSTTRRCKNYGSIVTPLESAEIVLVNIAVAFGIGGDMAIEIRRQRAA